jgi:SagB-type dehydrogenase family enzyme
MHPGKGKKVPQLRDEMTMGTDSDQIRHYVDLVRSRRRGARSLLIPADHRVDWNDAPSKFNIRVDAARVPLSSSLNSKGLRLGESVILSTSHGGRFVSIEELSDFLLLTMGILRRKLAVNWSVNGRGIAAHRSTTYSRGTASGGGLYPVVIYFLLRDRIGLQPGVYQYDDAHHALTRVRLGSFEPSLAAAINFPEADSSDLLVVLTVRFWKSSFKYHNFSFQVATQDVGACIGSMEQVAHALGWSTTTIYWFRDRLISSLLGLDNDREAPFAILTVGKPNSTDRRKSFPSASLERVSTEHIPSIRHEMYERSRRTFIPEMLLPVHKATLLEKVQRPVLPPSLWPLTIPSTSQQIIRSDFGSLLAHRQTTWGMFRREPALEAEVLERVLEFVAYGVHYNSDLYRRRVALPSLRIALIAQNVANLQQGVYDYNFENARLSRPNNWVSRSSMQSIYSLMNQNIDQVSAVLVMVGRLDAVLSTFGGRGIRVMNAEAGMAAQRAYLATAALSLGCGAALGFDAHRVSEILDLDNDVEIPLLLIFIGHRCDDVFAYDFTLV